MTQPYWPPQPPSAKRGPNWWLIGGAAALAVVLVAALVVVGGVLIARRIDDKPQSEPLAASGVACSYTSRPGSDVSRTVKLPPRTGVPDHGQVVAQLQTNQGGLALTLDRGETPCTVNSFVSLARQKYFDQTSCHRLTTSGIYVLQCGDPGGSGAGGPGYSYANENLPEVNGGSMFYPAGTVAMANAGPGTNGSQFFIVYQDTLLPPNYTMFGTVTTGLDVVQRVAAAGSAPAGDGRPIKPVNIESVRVR